MRIPRHRMMTWILVASISMAFCLPNTSRIAFWVVSRINVSWFYLIRRSVHISGVRRVIMTAGSKECGRSEEGWEAILQNGIEITVTVHIASLFVVFNFAAGIFQCFAGLKPLPFQICYQSTQLRLLVCPLPYVIYPAGIRVQGLIR